ncbi:MAG: hypothetical protein ACK5NK_11290 [Niabella sp.]
MNCRILVAAFSFLIFSSFFNAGATNVYRDTIRKTTTQEAITYLNSIVQLDKSKYWPHIDPDQFLLNLKTFTIEPLAFYEGKATNFCAYSALTYIPLEYDPLGFSKFMITLYKYGKANMGNTSFKPSKAVREEAGQIKYKGALDINPAGQMWFLALADKFKGYLNIFNRNFDKGDENTFWASTNYAKFNRMLRQLFLVKTKAKGADLFRPKLNDITAYMADEVSKGMVFVYLNNKKLYRKSHAKPVISTPTHFVMLVGAKRLNDDMVEFVYWDYGRKSLQHLPANFLENIVYGITTIKFKTGK